MSIQSRILLLILIFAFAPAYSQFYQARNFNTEDGLPGSDVYGMLQDSKGFMWFATDMGVSRYNGYTFENFSKENGLPDITIFGFFEDQKGRIWMRSLSGRLSYFYHDSIYTPACNKTIYERSQEFGEFALSMFVDKNDTVWLGTRKGIIKIAPPWEPANLSFYRDPGRSEFIYLVNDTTIIFGGQSHKEYKVRLYDHRFRNIFTVSPTPPASTMNEHRFYARRLHDGTFVASVSNLAYRFSNDSVLGQHKEKEIMIDMEEDGEGNIIGCTYNGALIYEKSSLLSGRPIPILSSKVVTGVMVDHENSLWFSTEGHGVYYIPFRSNRYYTPENGLGKSKITSLCTSGNSILTGHLDGTISVIRDSVITIRDFKKKSEGAATGRINSLHTTNGGSIFVCANSGLFRLSGEEFDRCELSSDYRVKKLARADKDLYWILGGTHVFFGDPANRKNTLLDVLNPYFSDDLLFDSKGVLWVSSINGLLKLEHDSLVPQRKEQELLGLRIVNLGEDGEGRMWMTTRGEGLLVRSGNEMVQIKKANGLADNMCRCLFLDSDNTVWVGSSKGLSRIRVLPPGPSGGLRYTITVFTKLNGLLTNEINYIARKGKALILAHNNALSLFDPTAVSKSTYPAPVYITSISTSDSTFKEGPIRVPYSSSYLRINYVGLYFKRMGNIEYRYRMEGLDTNWIYTKYTTAQFQALSPGSYRFLVSAKNDDGNWSSRPASIELTVLPLWWQSLLFRIGAPLLVFLAIYLLIRSRVNLVQRRKHERSELEGKLALTELKALRAQMNPHFIFNSLANIESFIYSNEPREAGRYLSDFSRLMRLILENSASEYITLAREVETLERYLALQRMRMNDKMIYTIEVEKDLDTEQAFLPPMLTQPFIENAIEHGFMGSQKTGEIHISFHIAGTQLKVEVTDNGIGIVQAARQKKLNETHLSMATQITRDRLAVLSRSKKQHLTLEITDLSDEQSNRTGTRVVFYIPLTHS